MGARFGISKGIRNAENNHRDDGIEEPLGTVEHLTQYGGMYSNTSAAQIRSSFASIYSQFIWRQNRII